MAKKTNVIKKTSANPNLPPVSKQAAGGVTGAVIGGLFGGPIGALVGGVAGAAVGTASAKGKEPIKKTVEKIRSMGKGRTTTAKAAGKPKAASASIGMKGSGKAHSKPTSAKQTRAKQAAAKSKSSKSKATGK